MYKNTKYKQTGRNAFNYAVHYVMVLCLFLQGAKLRT